MITDKQSYSAACLIHYRVAYLTWHGVMHHITSIQSFPVSRAGKALWRKEQEAFLLHLGSSTICPQIGVQGQPWSSFGDWLNWVSPTGVGLCWGITVSQGEQNFAVGWLSHLPPIGPNQAPGNTWWWQHHVVSGLTAAIHQVSRGQQGMSCKRFCIWLHSCQGQPW